MYWRGWRIKELKVKLLTETAKIPVRAHATDAGLDIFADEDILLTSDETQTVSTGIAIEIPEGYYGRLKGRSGLTSKTNLRVQEGTIDQQYRGEIKVICDLRYDPLEGPKETPSGTIHYHVMHKISKGDKIAQLIIQEVPYFTPVEVDELSATDRGDGGFGSTGK